MFFLILFVSTFSYTSTVQKSELELCTEREKSIADNPIPEINHYDYCKTKKRLEEIKGKCRDELIEWMKIKKPEEPASPTPAQTEAYNREKSKYDKAEQQFDKCEEKMDEILNEEWGKDCKEQVEKKYETEEAWEAENSKASSDEEELKKLEEKAEKAEKALKKCKEKKGYTKENERCSDAAKELKDVRQEFNDSCGELGGDADSCIRSLKSCSECDNLSSDTSADDVDCVMIRQAGICPELATDFLEDLKEEKEDFEDKIKDLEEKLETLKEDKSQLEAELNDEKLAFEADIKELRTKEEELKEELEANFKNIKAETKAAFETARAKVLAEIDKSDQLQYQLSNSIEEAHRKYRRERQKIYEGCKVQAKEKLNEYRKARKIAIAEGRFKQETIQEAVSENRTTFAQKDDSKFSKYYRTCIKETRHFVNALREDFQFELKKIEQQKQMIIKQLESMKSQMHALANEANAKEQTLLHDYFTQLSKITEKIQKEVDSRTGVYLQKSTHIGEQLTGNFRKNIIGKDQEIIQVQAILRETQYKFNHNQEMRNRLRSAGASDEDKSSQLADASSSHNDLIEEWDSAFEICECEPGSFKKDEEAKECKQIKRAGQLVEPDHDNLRDSSRNRRSGSSGSSSVSE